MKRKQISDSIFIYSLIQETQVWEKDFLKQQNKLKRRFIPELQEDFEFFGQEIVRTIHEILQKYKKIIEQENSKKNKKKIWKSQSKRQNKRKRSQDSLHQKSFNYQSENLETRSHLSHLENLENFTVANYWSRNENQLSNSSQLLKDNKSIINFGEICLDKEMVPKAEVFKHFIKEISQTSSYPMSLLSKHTRLFQWVENYNFINDKLPTEEDIQNYYNTLSCKDDSFKEESQYFLTELSLFMNIIQYRGAYE